LSLRLEGVCGRAALILAAPLSLLHRLCFPDDPWSSTEMARIMAINGFFGRIAWDDDDPAGLALALDLGGECELLALGVASEHRRAGIGSALLTAICDEVAQRGGRRLFLEVAADNAAARALYTGSGFVQIGRRPNYYRRAAGLVDALVLCRKITCASPST
jgi:[ribosomal protein S18]-alanine N-acetyltransferase